MRSEKRRNILEMGRPRKRQQGLPKRVYLRRGSFWYVEPGVETWHRLALADDWGGMYEALAAHLAGKHKVSLETLLDRYAKEILPGKAAKTQIAQLQHIKVLKAWGGHLEPTAINRQAVVRYIHERGKVAPYSANREVAVLSHLFTVCVNRWGLEYDNPCLGVERNREQQRGYLVPGEDLMRAWQIAKPWLRALMALAYVTGQRKMDVANLRETDFKGRGLEIHQQKTGTGLMLEWTRGLRDARDYALSVRPVIPMARWLVCNRKGENCSDRAIRKEWARVMDALEAAGGARFQFKDIRGKSGTDHLTGNHLGHKSTAVRDKHYRLGLRVEKPL